MSEKHSKTGKLRRKKLSSSAKGWIDLEKEKEGGESYSSGHFYHFLCCVNLNRVFWIFCFFYTNLYFVT